MGFAIPRIQYKNVVSMGNTTLGDGTLSGIDDTTDVEVGMFARGTGIPTGATVLSKTDNSVTLAGGVLATATGASIVFNFGYEILFDYPPIEDTGEQLETKQVTSESLSGIRQVSVNNIEGTRKLKFSFLSPTLYTSVDTFLKTHALYGDAFRYYEDKTLTVYVDVELDTLKVQPKKIAPRGVDIYSWEVPLSFRRVL